MAASRSFGLSFKELHNDSTTIAFCGQYHKASGRLVRGRRAPAITHGHSKGRRPDLKQPLFILTASSDGNVPVQFRSGDGNTEDSTTHLETWKALVELTGRRDFLHVADSKLCAGKTLDAIDALKGLFVTVLPRSRYEDRQFRTEYSRGWPGPFAHAAVLRT